MKKTALAVAIALTGLNNVSAQTAEPPQTVGLGGWSTHPVLTIGETINGYTPPGIPDGMGAFEREDTVEILSNHELSADTGYPYILESGASLTGARVSRLVFDKKTRKLLDMDLAKDARRHPPPTAAGCRTSFNLEEKAPRPSHDQSAGGQSWERWPGACNCRWWLLCGV